ncbi:MAG: succinate dehydrogenase, hydrophobic membrane anchor protein [Casimicrobiaceae bacterium]
MRKAVSGLRAWLVQRVSAVYMLVFILFVLTHFLIDPPNSYLSWHDWVMSPGIHISASIFFAALLAHAWVGVRDVIIDYVHPIAVRVSAFALLGLGLTGIGAWVIRILWLGH